MRRLFLLVILWLTVQATAQDAPPVLTYLDILLVVHDNHTVTAMYRAGLEGETATEIDIPLNLPIPGSVLDVQFGDGRSFDLLDKATVIVPDYIPKPCDLSPTIVIGHGPGYTPYLPIPADIAGTEVVTSNTEQVTVTLHLQAYTLDDYEVDSYGGVLHQSPLIKITYRPYDTTLTLPFSSESAFTAEGRSVKLNVYLLADILYTVKDVPLVTVDAGQLRDFGHEVASTLSDTMEGPSYTSLREQYDSLVYRTLRETGERAFVRQFANTTDHALVALPTSEKLAVPRESVTELLAATPYLTRLDTIMLLNSTLEFLPAPETALFITDLNTALDPVYFYGCTTETLYDLTLEDAIPGSRVYVDALRAYVPLLEGWTLFDFEHDVRYQNSPIYAAAPESLTTDQAYRHAKGYANQITTAVLGLERFRVPYVEDEKGVYGSFDISHDPLTRFNLPFIPAVGANTFIWFWPHPDTYPLDDWSSDETAYGYGVKIRMVAPLADYAANAELYDKLLLYFADYQYFTHPDLRHTLFLGNLSGHIEVGYPEDWHTLNHPELGRLIAPNHVEDLAAAPYVRILSPSKDEALQTVLMEQFGLSEDALGDAYTMPAPYENENRRGFLRLGADEYGKSFIVEFSASVAVYKANAELLQTMSQAMRSLRYEERD